MKNDQIVKTGYASIDQPWKKYHRKELIREFDVNQTFSELLKSANQDNMDYNAISFMGFKGNTWTYEELFNMANRLADAYRKQGIKEGDNVLIATVSGMEEALNLIALNQLGAISKWIDITASERELEEAINNDDCKFVVCFAPVIPNLNKIIKDTDVKKALYVEPSQFIRTGKVLVNSLYDFKKILDLRKNSKSNPLPEMPDDERYMLFKDFLNSGDGKAKNIKSYYDKEKPVLKIQSSGTTGKPKVIVHTDFSINNSIYKFSGTDLPLYKGKVMLKTAPAWVGYGLINTLGVGLGYGMEVLTTPMLGDSILYDYNQKYDVVFGVPLHYRYLSANIDKIKSMDRPSALISGGDKISKKEVIEISDLFKEKGCKVEILNGAGNNEVLGAAEVNPVNFNRPGSIGIPMYGDITSIFDPDTNEELKIGQKGEICYKTNSAFMEYQDNQDLTNDVKKVHSDGSLWVHSKDLGYMDEDGFTFIDGRLSRVISVGAFKIAASQIEEVVQSHPAVFECVAVAIPDSEKGEVPMIHIVLKDEFKTEANAVLEDIKTLCYTSLKEKASPKYYNLLDEMPYTSNNKQDFRKLECLGKEIVFNAKQKQKVLK